MTKLPTTFQTLDLQGFEFDRAQQYSGITREMVDTACVVLQKNRIGIVVRSINSALNEIMRQQLKDFPQLQMEIGFYKSEYDRQRNELREAYMNLNKQQLGDAEQFRQQLDLLQSERNELEAKLSVSEKRLAEVAVAEVASRDRISEISRLNGQLEAREREISSLHSQMQTLQAAVGEKQVLEAQLEQVRSQFKTANETITHLQSQQKSTNSLEVDVDVDSLVAEKDRLEILLAQYKNELEASEITVSSLNAKLDEQVTDAQLMIDNETLHSDIQEYQTEIEHLKSQLTEFADELPVNWSVKKLGSDGGMYKSRNGLAVIISCCIEEDNKNWIHLSVSRKNSIPTWADLVNVKEVFLGENALALQVLPPRSEWVNVHKFCLHLYQCLDKRPIPDFRKLGTI